MIQIVLKKHWVTHELQGTDVFNKQRNWYMQLKKGGVVWMPKKIWKGLLGEKHLLGNVHFSVKNTANNVDT